MAGPRSPHASRRHLPLLAAVVIMTLTAGCVGPEAPGRPPLPPPEPSMASGPEPETVVTGPQGSVLTMTVAPEPEAPTHEHPDGITLAVTQLAYTEVPIAEDFARRGLAAGLEPRRYVLASGQNEGVTALVFALATQRETMHHHHGDTKHEGARHFWTALVVDPVDALRNPDADLHIVLLDAYSTSATTTGAWRAWSPVTRATAERVDVDVVDNETATVVDAHGPHGYRLTAETALPLRDAPATTIRVFGVDAHQVTGFIDLDLEDRQRRAGHGVAAKADPAEITFPPAAGFARYERPNSTNTFHLEARYSEAPPVPMPDDDGRSLVRPTDAILLP